MFIQPLHGKVLLLLAVYQEVQVGISISLIITNSLN